MARCVKPALKIIEGYEGLSGQRADGLFYPIQEKADRPDVFTIGKGHVVKRHEMEAFKKGLTQDGIEKLFELDIKARIESCQRHAGDCSDNEFNALFSLYYNYGAALASHRMGRFHRSGRKLRAAAAQLQYIYSAGKPRWGLWRRRMTEALYYLTGELIIAKDSKSTRLLFSKIKAIGLIKQLKLLKPKHPFMNHKRNL